VTAILLWLLLGILLGAGGTHAHHHVRRNYGGWSMARQVGASAVKARIGLAIGVPLTASGWEGRDQQFGTRIGTVWNLFRALSPARIFMRWST
jgi:hypothetical protein